MYTRVKKGRLLTATTPEPLRHEVANLTRPGVDGVALGRHKRHGPGVLALRGEDGEGCEYRFRAAVLDPGVGVGQGVRRREATPHVIGYLGIVGRFGQGLGVGGFIGPQVTFFGHQDGCFGNSVRRHLTRPFSAYNDCFRVCHLLLVVELVYLLLSDAVERSSMS